VDGIVHNTHAYAGHSYPAGDIKAKKQPRAAHNAAVDQTHGHKEQCQHQNSLANHATVGVLADVVGLEIGVYPTSQCLREIRGSSFREFWIFDLSNDFVVGPLLLKSLPPAFRLKLLFALLL
jgi:hypothetical protein